MHASKRLPQTAEQIGSWLPFSELRPNFWLAEHDEIGGQVFLEIFVGTARDRDLRDRLLLHNELSRSGPGIARVVELFVNGPDLLAAIECAGEPLSERRGAQDTREVAAIGESIGRALARLHDRGRVHGMLWTGSILDGKRGSGAVLLDLGWCAPIGQVVKTTGWCSVAPENIGGAPLTVASDVWGLGGLLYSLLTNQFYDGRRVELPGVDRRLAAVIRGCLDLDPQSRYQTVAEVVASLGGVGSPQLSLLEVVPRSAPPPFVVVDEIDVVGQVDIEPRRMTRQEALEAWGEDADWFIDEDQPLTEDQMIGLYGFKQPMSRLGRRAVVFATTGLALASTLGLALLGLGVLG